MWYAVFFTRFMPGWMINIALVVHSDEALLAAGFIFTFHFFNAHFPAGEIPDGHRDLLRSHLEDRNAS